MPNSFLGGGGTKSVSEGKFSLGGLMVFTEQILFRFAKYKMIFSSAIWYRLVDPLLLLLAFLNSFIEIQFTYHTVYPLCTILWILVYSQNCTAIITVSIRNFLSPQKETHQQWFSFPCHPPSHRVTTSSNKMTEWIVSFSLLIQYIILIDFFQILNQPFIPGINPICAWCGNLFVCCQIQFASVLSRIFESVLTKHIDLQFSCDSLSVFGVKLFLTSYNMLGNNFPFLLFSGVVCEELVLILV